MHVDGITGGQSMNSLSELKKKVKRLHKLIKEHVRELIRWESDYSTSHLICGSLYVSISGDSKPYGWYSTASGLASSIAYDLGTDDELFDIDYADQYSMRIVRKKGIPLKTWLSNL